METYCYKCIYLSVALVREPLPYSPHEVVHYNVHAHCSQSVVQLQELLVLLLYDTRQSKHLQNKIT